MSPSASTSPPDPTADEIRNWPTFWLKAQRASLPQSYKRVGAAIWEWGDEADGYTAILSGDSISWNWHGPKDLGNTIGQSVVDFVAFGPDEKTVPEGLPWEIFSAIRNRDFRHWPQLLDKARAISGDLERGQTTDRQSHSSISWRWGDKHNQYSATLTDSQVVWVWEGPKDQGGAADQPFEDFLSSGPLETSAPARVVQEIRNAILKQGARRMPRPLQQRSSQDLAGQKKPLHLTDPSLTSNEPGPLAELLAQGIFVIAASTAIAVLLAIVFPTLAKYASIILPVLFGFFAAFRWGSLSLIVAGFFAMAGGLGSQIALERYAELTRGAAVTLASIAEAPLHPDATRFIVSDVRAVRVYIGRAQRTILVRSGAGPTPQIVAIQVMPLVPAGWTRDQPVPAWLACSTTPGFDCFRSGESGGSRIVRVRDYDLSYYREAILDARRRHGVTSENGAPILETNSDPFGAPEFYLAGVVALPLGAYLLWVIGVLGGRFWQRYRATNE